MLRYRCFLNESTFSGICVDSYSFDISAYQFITSWCDTYCSSYKSHFKCSVLLDIKLIRQFYSLWRNLWVRSERLGHTYILVEARGKKRKSSRQVLHVIKLFVLFFHLEVKVSCNKEHKFL